MSIVRAEQAGDQNEPSPSIWKNCPKGLLRDMGLGYFVREDFLGGTADVLALNEQRPHYGDLSIDADDDTVVAFKAGERGGFLDVETDGDDNDAWALFTEPFAEFRLFSEQAVWFEIAVELGDVTMDGGAFLGFVEESGASRDVVADAAGAIGDFDFVGFQILTGNPDAVDAVHRVSGTAVVVTATDITNNAALGTAAASLVNDTQVKLGFFFNANSHVLDYFVNGTRVAGLTVPAATFPVNTLMSAISSLKTGAAAAESAAQDWIQAAHQLRR